MLKDKTEFVITIGGTHRGSPFANVWCDNWASSWSWLGDTTPEMKNALEIGGAASEISGSYNYDGISLFTFNGSWGSASEYYYYDNNDLRIPKHFDYDELDVGMVENSDGMVPNFSACPNDIAGADKRRLVYTMSDHGMAHDDPDNNGELSTETHITWFSTEVVLHGFFASLTNILAGGNINKTDEEYTASVDQTIGCACNEYNVPAFVGSIYAENSSNEYPLWQQDEDYDLLGQPEKPYKILVAPAGMYSVKYKTIYLRVSNVFGIPILEPVYDDINIGTIIVEGGKVKIY